MANLVISSAPVTDRSTVVVIAGDVTTDNYESIEAEFRNILDAGMIGVVVDLSKAGALTSAAIGAIASLGRTLKKRNGKIFTVPPKGESAGLMEMLGLEDLFEFVAGVDEGKRKVVSLK